MADPEVPALRQVDGALELVEAARTGDPEQWQTALGAVRPTSDTVFVLAMVLANMLDAEAQRQGVAFTDVLHMLRVQAARDVPPDGVP